MDCITHLPDTAGVWRRFFLLFPSVTPPPDFGRPAERCSWASAVGRDADNQRAIGLALDY